MSQQALQRIVDDINKGRLAAARASLQRLYVRAPADPKLNALMTSIASKEQNWQQVLHYGAKAVENGLKDADIHNSMGVAQLALRNTEAGIEQFRRSIEIDPNSTRGHAHICAILSRENRVVELEHAARRAHSLFPADDRFVSDLGVALFEQFRSDEAIAVLRSVLFKRPTSHVSGQIASYLNYMAGATLPEIRDAAVSFGRILSLLSPTLPPPPASWKQLDPEKRLRLGFVSGDLRDHSVSRFLLPLLEALDRRRFEFCFYSNSPYEDAVSRRYKSIATMWRSIRGVEDAPVAAQMRTDGIDIAFDMSGVTMDHRLPVFGARVAPLQVSFIGSPATTGMKEMDVRIVDSITDPPGNEAFCTERLLRLEPPFLCYQPSADAPHVAPPPCTTAGTVTFGSFNAAQKYNQPLLQDWVAILRAVPGSKLVLKAPSLHKTQVRDAFLTEWGKAGGTRDELDILPYSKTAAEHLAQYAKVDVALDPFPYHGTTTTCEALYMGVPVVSRVGTIHVSRVGATLLHRVGLDDLICRDRDAYIATAIRVGGDHERLIALRRSLRDRMAATLTDAAAYALRWEAGIRQEWIAACARWGG